jgi:hypothetical protein
VLTAPADLLKRGRIDSEQPASEADVGQIHEAYF